MQLHLLLIDLLHGIAFKEGKYPIFLLSTESPSTEKLCFNKLSKLNNLEKNLTAANDEKGK
jgi:hypothetical protein